MKTISILIIFTVLTISAYTQEIISSAGGHSEAHGAQISWTLGEPVIETISGGDNTLTQGFHQTKLLVTPVFSITQNNEISVYPNPTKDIVYIQVNGSQMLKSVAGLYSSNGKLLKQFSLIDERTILKTQEFPNGSYLLKISKDNTLFQTFKLVKMY